MTTMLQSCCCAAGENNQAAHDHDDAANDDHGDIVDAGERGGGVKGMYGGTGGSCWRACSGGW